MRTSLAKRLWIGRSNNYLRALRPKPIAYAKLKQTMNTDRDPGLPDYSALAAIFDRMLPLIAPVADAILEHVPALPAGARVLDVACGTGEPGLSLAVARRMCSCSGSTRRRE